MKPKSSTSASLSTGSVSPPLLERAFGDNHTALKNWSSYKDKYFTRSVDIYLRLISAQEGSSQPSSPINTKSVAVQSSTEMRMACAFVLASNHQWNFQYHQGKLHLVPGSLEDVDTSMLFDIQQWCDASGDTLTYEFFLRDKHLPKKFVDFILTPYFKKLCTPDGPNSTTVKTSQTSIAGSADSDKLQSISSRSNCDTLRPTDTSTQSIDEHIEAALTKCNIRATPKASIEASITPQRLMAAKSELLRNLALSVNQSSENAEKPEPQESPSATPQQEAIAPLQQVNTETFVDDEYRKYLHQKTLKTFKRCWKKRLIIKLDVIMQWILRSKRICFLNFLDMTVGSTVNVILAFTMPLLGGVAFIAAPIYVLAATGTLIFWFITHSITAYVMTRWHRHQSTHLRSRIIEIETSISAYKEHIERLCKQLKNKKIDNDNCAECNAVLMKESIDLNKFKTELKQKKQNMFKSLIYLSRHNSFSDSLIKERRAFDRIAKEITKLKDVAHNSFADANRYETAMTELTCQQKHLEPAMDPITESIIMALEVFSQDKSSIEKDLNTLLGDDKNELDIFGSMSANDLGQLFSKASHIKWKSRILSVFQRIWYTLYKPPIVAHMLDTSRKESQHNKATLLGNFSEKANEISPEQYAEIKHEGEKKPTLLNPNTRLANLFSKAQEGINTSHVISEQSTKLELATFAYGAQTVFRTTVSYCIYYLRRIPYRLHELGVTWALISGIKLNFLNLLKDAFPSPGAVGGIGIVLWGWFKYMATKFEEINNQLNQALCTSREEHMKNYKDPPYDLDTIPSWMTLNASKTCDSDNAPIVRKREQMGHFNAGVLDDSPVQGLSEGEWHAVRRQAKHASIELPPLLNALEQVKLELSTLTKQLRNESKATSGQKIVVEKASNEKIARLLIRYNLLAHRLQQVIKTTQQANYELVRHVHRVNQQVKILSRPQQ